MNPRGYIVGLVRILLPTPLQALTAVVVSLLALGLINIQQIFSLIGFQVNAAGISRLIDGFINLAVFTDKSLIFSSAGIGLIAYLLIWLIYNGVISSRTQVSAETGVVDTSAWLGLMLEMAIKAATGFLLIEYLMYFRAIMGLWLGWSSGVLHGVSLVSAGSALGAVFGFALQLYLLFALIQAVVLPWYRSAE